MWSLPYHDDRLVAISFYPHAMTCSIIERAKTAAPFVVQAYERFELRNLELENLIIFNPTNIKRLVHTFLKKYRVEHAFVACSLRGPQLFEHYVTLQSQKPKSSDFMMPELKKLAWDFEYIYPTDHGKSVFYVTGLPHALIAQYQLFAINAQLHMTKLIPESMALLQVYRYQRGTAFRRTQLALDMRQHHNIIEYLFNKDTLGRILHIPNHVALDRMREIGPLLTACGLFISERIHHEKH
jgi:hypothetical protein